MQVEGVSLQFDSSVQDYFSGDINAFADILIRRLMPIFDDVEAEHQRAGEEFLASYKGNPDDYDSAMEGAYEHANDHAMRFAEMRDVFVAVGVAGLFHLFEKQVYRHTNNELRYNLDKPIAHWRDVTFLVERLRHKREGDSFQPSSELVDAFKNPDLIELQNVANAVKHGQDGAAFKALQQSGARVVGEDPNLAAFSILRVTLTLTPEDIIRYRDAILGFWRLRGEFWAPLTAFK